MEDRKNATPEILSAKDLQDMGFSRSMSYALFNREDIPVIRIGKRKFSLPRMGSNSVVKVHYRLGSRNC